MAGIKDKENKLDWSLLDYEVMQEVIKVLMYGAEKYSPDNYKKGLARKDLISAIQRHLVKIAIAENRDEEYDEETGYHHAAHIVCNCLFYMHNFAYKKFTDQCGETGS